MGNSTFLLTADLKPTSVWKTGYFVLVEMSCDPQTVLNALILPPTDEILLDFWNTCI